MYVDRIVFPVQTLGPGNRIVIWLAGCSRKCKNCSNPELWDQHLYQNIGIDELIRAIIKICMKNRVDGLTISGGEPFDQAEDLAVLLEQIKEYTSDILVYTGYREEELRSVDTMNAAFSFVSVLIDGDYQAELNDGKVVLRGSTNQRLIIRDMDLKERYKNYIEEGRKIQNLVYDNTILSIGIHDR